jgi:hypothetical protein
MRGFKEPGFNDRVNAAKRAKEAALEKLRNKPPVDEAEVARKIARQQEKEAAAIAKREEARLAKEAEEAARERAAREAEAAKEEAAREAEAARLAKLPKIMTEAERKAYRDARYAARKARAKRG